MKFYLLPLSTRRSLLYCVHKSTKPPTYVDKATEKAAKLWLSWERSEIKWQRTIVTRGNQLMSKIPYEEWSLKHIPSLTEPDLPKDPSIKITLEYPKSILKASTIKKQLQQLATSRQSIHRSRLIWSFVGMPIVAPFAIVPVIPNIPFFYLAYRAFSHYKALLGIKHLQHLLDKDRLDYINHEGLDQVFLDGARGSLGGSEGVEQAGEERMLLSQAGGKGVAESIGMPEIAVEWERAWGQVNRDIVKQREERGQVKSGEVVEEKEEKEKLS